MAVDSDFCIRLQPVRLRRSSNLLPPFPFCGGTQGRAGEAVARPPGAVAGRGQRRRFFRQEKTTTHHARPPHTVRVYSGDRKGGSGEELQTGAAPEADGVRPGRDALRRSGTEGIGFVGRMQSAATGWPGVRLQGATRTRAAGDRVHKPMFCDADGSARRAEGPDNVAERRLMFAGVSGESVVSFRARSPGAEGARVAGIVTLSGRPFSQPFKSKVTKSLH